MMNHLKQLETETNKVVMLNKSMSTLVLKWLGDLLIDQKQTNKQLFRQF